MKARDQLDTEQNVLILVLLELILLHIGDEVSVFESKCFNPCFIGTYSFTSTKTYTWPKKIMF